MAQVDQTPESKTFDELLPTIETAITMGVQPLATQAFSSGLITSVQLNTCTHIMYPPNQQAHMFLADIRNRVAVNPEALRSFRNILNMEAVYQNIVKKIGKPLFIGGVAEGLGIAITCSVLTTL